MSDIVNGNVYESIAANGRWMYLVDSVVDEIVAYTVLHDAKMEMTGKKCQTTRADFVSRVKAGAK